MLGIMQYIRDECSAVFPEYVDIVPTAKKAILVIPLQNQIVCIAISWAQCIS